MYVRSGSTAAGRDAVEWAREAESRGAGEILLTSIDRDGTKIGFDCEMTAAVSRAVSIPVIASGGAGTLDDFVDVFTTGRADAALAASIFHYAETSVRALKQHLQQRGIPGTLVNTKNRRPTKHTKNRSHETHETKTFYKASLSCFMPCAFVLSDVFREPIRC